MTRTEAHLRTWAHTLSVNLHLFTEPDPLDCKQHNSPTGASFLYDYWYEGYKYEFKGPWAAVWRWDPNDELPYWACLHELGHHAIGFAGPVIYDETLPEGEADVWEWCLTHSCLPITRRLYDVMRRDWLGSYCRMYGRSPKAQAFLDRLGNEVTSMQRWQEYYAARPIAATSILKGVQS